MILKVLTQKGGRMSIQRLVCCFVPAQQVSQGINESRKRVHNSGCTCPSCMTKTLPILVSGRLDFGSTLASSEAKVPLPVSVFANVDNLDVLKAFI